MDVDARMTWISRTLQFGLLCLAPVLFATAAQAAADNPWDGSVHTDMAVYGWLPGVSGDLRFELPNSGRAETKSDNNILENLEGALMVQTVVRAGDWGFFGDLDWVKFGDQKGRFTHIGGDSIGADLNLDTRWNIKGGMLTMAALYTLGHDSWGFADLLFGARYLWIKSNLSWDFGGTGNDGFQIDNSGHVARNSHVTAGVIGPARTPQPRRRQLVHAVLHRCGCRQRRHHRAGGARRRLRIRLGRPRGRVATHILFAKRRLGSDPAYRVRRTSTRGELALLTAL